MLPCVLLSLGRAALILLYAGFGLLQIEAPPPFFGESSLTSDDETRISRLDLCGQKCSFSEKLQKNVIKICTITEKKNHVDLLTLGFVFSMVFQPIYLPSS